ncbi:MAG TPA: nucleotide sugar dehydrogenase [Alphaproteobacteria bacterium]|nr:nucleotide sugar dehydrogenase [Alphaproteobacteria bacterium]
MPEDQTPNPAIPIARIAVIGLGYVGLPLAVAFARHFTVIGYDTNEARIAELQTGEDRTGEVAPERLAEAAIEFRSGPDGLPQDTAELYIITVPTPVDASNEPDLSVLVAACRDVGGALVPGNLVVVESTVYPGVTEEVCAPALEAASGLVWGKDFHLGYSPERINPGDGEHTLARIIKVVAGDTAETAATVAKVYATICTAGVHRAPNIKTAEAAKAIENAQRDINIAFVNEVAMITGRLGLSVHDVLEAAGTKWNFLPFTPGLVGGHCIGVDPYYLAHKARAMGHEPDVILAGRRINDAMGEHLAARIDAALGRTGRILVLGLTFKENVPDLRNSKVADLIGGLAARGHAVTVADPLADITEAQALYGVALLRTLDGAEHFDAVVGAVPHDAYAQMSAADLAGLLVADGLVADIKGMWRRLTLPGDLRRWAL